MKIGGTRGDGNGIDPNLKNEAKKIGLVISVLLFFWLTRPMWHSVYRAIWLANPSTLSFLVQAVLGTVGVLGALVYTGRISTRRATGIFSAAMLVFSIAALILAPVVGNIYAKEHKAQEVMANAEERSDLPDVDPSRPRVLPANVGNAFARDSLQLPRYRTASPDITFAEDGTPQWSYSLAPDGFVNTLASKQAGAMFVDMTTEKKTVRPVEAQFDCGVGMAITDDYQWQALTERFNVEYRDPFVVEHDSDLVLAVPYIEFEHHYRFPVMYAVPQFGGVAVIDTDCNINHISAEDAPDHPALENQQFYPHGLARWEVNSLQYRHGWLNKVFIHQEQLEIAEVPGEDNDQPFTVPAADGSIDMIIAVEPWGDAHGVFQVWVIDGQTGEMEYRTFDATDALLGPSKAAQMAKKESPRVQWGSQIKVSEPIPAIVNGKLYWQIRAVSGDGSGISFTSFVDAESADVYEVETDEEVRDFIRYGP